MRTWEILVHEFATVNAGELTRRCLEEGEDSLSIEAILPVWNEVPVPWEKFGLLCARRNAHFHHRLNNTSLATFCQYELENRGYVLDTESPAEPSESHTDESIGNWQLENRKNLVDTESPAAQSQSYTDEPTENGE